MPNKTEPFSPEKFIFLDRDGVINRDSSNYIKSLEEFEFLPGSLDALKRLTEEDYRIIIITNQSIIGRKWISLEALEEIFVHMKTEIRNSGGRIHDIFFCPHTPEEGCLCRKPLPGLITRAVKTHLIDISTTTMVGDSAKDIICAKNAGCKHSVLVKTGNYKAALEILHSENLSPDAVVENLGEAVDWILEVTKEQGNDSGGQTEG